jgi:hypothetical protein
MGSDDLSGSSLLFPASTRTSGKRIALLYLLRVAFLAGFLSDPEYEGEICLGNFS